MFNQNPNQKKKTVQMNSTKQFIKRTHTRTHTLIHSFIYSQTHPQTANTLKERENKFIIWWGKVRKEKKEKERRKKEKEKKSIKKSKDLNPKKPAQRQ